MRTLSRFVAGILAAVSLLGLACGFYTSCASLVGLNLAESYPSAVGPSEAADFVYQLRCGLGIMLFGVLLAGIASVVLSLGRNE